MGKFILKLFVVLAIIAAFVLITKFANSIDNRSYDFSYTSTQTVSNTVVKTQVKKCVVFDAKKISLDKAKQQFIKDYGSGGKLFVSDGCTTNSFGNTIYPKIFIE